MPGYLVDEGGERTHVVLPVEEYERLKRATEHLEAVRGHAVEIMDVINRGNDQSPVGARPRTAPPEPESEPASEPKSESSRAEASVAKDSPESGTTRGYGWQK